MDRAHPCANGSINGTQSGIYVNPAGVNRLTIAPSTSTITAGGNRTYIVLAYDAFGNSVGSVRATLSISPNGSCGTTSCTATIAGSHTVTAKYSGKSVTASLNVAAAAASFLVFGQQPTDTHRNSNIGPAGPSGSSMPTAT